jgi:Ca-activated chloride channel family protein
MTKILFITLLLLALVAWYFRPARRPDVWRTPDQRAQRAFDAGQFNEAAKLFTSPDRQGIAAYRGADFKAAAAAFARDPSAESAYNRGNALVMLGKYDDAMKSYERALQLRPDWKNAVENRQLAERRRDQLKATGGDETGGEVEADKIVFDLNKQRQATTVQVDSEKPLSDAELQATWLRRVQTKPADFLKAKFQYQLQAAEQKP